MGSTIAVITNIFIKQSIYFMVLLLYFYPPPQYYALFYENICNNGYGGICLYTVCSMLLCKVFFLNNFLTVNYCKWSFLPDSQRIIEDPRGEQQLGLRLPRVKYAIVGCNPTL